MPTTHHRVLPRQPADARVRARLPGHQWRLPAGLGREATLPATAVGGLAVHPFPRTQKNTRKIPVVLTHPYHSAHGAHIFAELAFLEHAQLGDLLLVVVLAARVVHFLAVQPEH